MGKVRGPWIVRAGRWLTKRRSILFAPVFTTALFAARMATHPWGELGQDVAGAICLIAGTWLRLVAASYHESSHRSEPITAGPYAWLRHPLYAANFLLGLGVVLLAGWWPMIIGYCLFFIPLHWVIAKAEEVHLSRLYGAKYEFYRQRVPALFPWRPFPAPRYGTPSAFKLRKGREWFKLLGYLAGASGILLFKRARSLVTVPTLRPLPALYWFFGSAIVAAAVILRPKTRSSWLRGAQTAVATVCVLLLAIHLPGVWPSARSAPAAIRPSVSTAPAAVSPEKIPPQVNLPAERETMPLPSSPVSPRPHGLLSGIGHFLWDHLDVVGGASALGIAAMVEHEREERQGRAFQMERDFDEVGPVALGVAAALSVLQQWHQASAVSALPSVDDPWRFQVRPALDEDRRVTVLATFKRRF